VFLSIEGRLPEVSLSKRARMSATKRAVGPGSAGLYRRLARGTHHQTAGTQRRLRIMQYIRACSVSLIFAVGLAAAGDVPPRKPGLWEMALSTASSKRPPRIARYCIDAATAALMDNFAAGATQQNCRKNESHHEGVNTVVDSECTIGTSKVTGHAVISASDNAHFHIVIHSHFDPPLYGPADVDTVQESKWLSACPADMQPGDMISATGVKVNLKNVLGLPR
jgi:hypothetical protein